MSLINPLETDIVLKTSDLLPNFRFSKKPMVELTKSSTCAEQRDFKMNHSEVSIEDRTQALVSGLVHVISLAGATLQIINQLSEQVRAFLDVEVSESIWMKQAKYLLCYPLALYLSKGCDINTLPECAGVPFNPKSNLRKWMNKRLKTFCPENTWLWSSWLQCKRACLVVSDEIVVETYEKHFLTLTDKSKIKKSTCDQVMANRSFIAFLEDFAAKVAVEWKSKSKKIFPPSTGAAFENSRSEGGQADEIYKDLRTTFAEPDFDNTISSPFTGIFDHTDLRVVDLPPSDDQLLLDVHKSFRKRRIGPLGRIGITNDSFDEGQSAPTLDGVDPCSFTTIKVDETVPQERIPSRDEMIAMVWYPYRRGIRTGMRVNVTETFYGEPFFGPIRKLLSHERLGLTEIQEHNLKMFLRKPRNNADIVDRVLGPGWDKPYDARIQAVLEPLKVRVISKGPAQPYYRMKRLQKTLHTVLRSYPCFRLTGKTFEMEDINDILNLLQPGDHWFSIDYSSATDNLAYTLSRRIMNLIIDSMPVEVQVEARKVLGLHLLWYPGEKVSRGQMRNGQLMGSPLSFPILCLANLGLYLHVTQNLHQNRGLTDNERFLSVLINGDDMVYAAPKKLWAKHVRIGSEVGLTMSVGKAYCHSEYLNINSTSCHCQIPTPGSKRAEILQIDRDYHRNLASGLMTRPPVRDTWKPRMIPFFNSGLFMGQRKVLKDDRDNESNLVSTINEILCGCWNDEQRVHVLKVLMVKYRDEILNESRIIVKENGIRQVQSRNLFFPTSLGGMGVNCPPGFVYRVTQTQGKIASMLIHMSEVVGNVLPLNTPESPWIYHSKEKLPWDTNGSDSRENLIEIPLEDHKKYHNKAVAAKYRRIFRADLPQLFELESLDSCDTHNFDQVGIERDFIGLGSYTFRCDHTCLQDNECPKCIERISAGVVSWDYGDDLPLMFLLRDQTIVFNHNVTNNNIQDFQKSLKYTSALIPDQYYSKWYREEQCFPHCYDVGDHPIEGLFRFKFNRVQAIMGQNGAGFDWLNATVLNKMSRDCTVLRKEAMDGQSASIDAIPYET